MKSAAFVVAALAGSATAIELPKPASEAAAVNVPTLRRSLAADADTAAHQYVDDCSKCGSYAFFGNMGNNDYKTTYAANSRCVFDKERGMMQGTAAGQPYPNNGGVILSATGPICSVESTYYAGSFYPCRVPAPVEGDAAIKGSTGMSLQKSANNFCFLKNDDTTDAPAAAVEGLPPHDNAFDVIKAMNDDIDMFPGTFEILSAAVEKAGLVDTLSDADGAFTIFAPTDQAFVGFVDCGDAKDPKNCAMNSIEAADEAALTKLLLGHVIVDNYYGPNTNSVPGMWGASHEIIVPSLSSGEEAGTFVVAAIGVEADECTQSATTSFNAAASTLDIAQKFIMSKTAAVYAVDHVIVSDCSVVIESAASPAAYTAAGMAVLASAVAALAL